MVTPSHRAGSGGYWIPHRVGPSTPRFVNIFLGHVVLFLARLIFLLPVALFSFMFINNKLEIRCRCRDTLSYW
jgi:hypothetical protein